MVDAGEHAFERVLIAFFIADKFDVQVFRDLLELGADADEVARYLLSEIEDVARLLQCLIGIHRVQGALIEFRKLVFYTLLLGQEDFAAPVDVAVGCERQFRYLVEDHVQLDFVAALWGFANPLAKLMAAKAPAESS